jgi:hypothetical protein
LPDLRPHRVHQKPLQLGIGRDGLAKKVGLSAPKATAVIRFLHLQADQDCYEQITIGKSKFDPYSQKAITAIQDALKKLLLLLIPARSGTFAGVFSTIIYQFL